MAEDLALELVRFQVAASMRRARLRSTSLVASSSALARAGATQAAAAFEQLAGWQPAQLLAEPVGSGDDHAAQLRERFAADVDGAATSDQQQPQRLPPLT